MTLRIKEKENYLVEAGELLLEAQKHYETQRGKAEQLLREKAAVIGENQSSRDQLQAELEKAQFDLQELEVTAETLRIENKQMVQEISDISGDAAVERTQSAAVRSNTSPKDNYRNNVNSNADAFSPNAGVTDDGDSSIPGTGSLGMTLSSNIMTEGTKMIKFPYLHSQTIFYLRGQYGTLLSSHLVPVIFFCHNSSVLFQYSLFSTYVSLFRLFIFLAMSRHVLSNSRHSSPPPVHSIYLVLSCLVLSYLVLSCLVFFFLN